MDEEVVKVSIVDSSILDDIKKYIGPAISYTVFDMDLIMNINAAFFTLYQLGVGSSDKVFTITDNKTTWSNFSFNENIVSAVKQYIYLKVRNVFDPPTSSYVLSAYESQIQELEWRLRELAAGMFESDECWCPEIDDKLDHVNGEIPPCKPCRPPHNKPDDSESDYVLPPATKETLGGVIVGDNLNVDDEGRISLDKLGAYEIDVATKEDVNEMLDRVFGRKE